jgi:hypothetical protein
MGEEVEMRCKQSKPNVIDLAAVTRQMLRLSWIFVKL